MRSPVTSQLKPTRGDQRMLASGSLPVSYWTARAGLVAERELVGIGVRVGGVVEERHVHAQTGGDADIAAHLPHVLGVEARVPDREGLDGLLHAGDVVPAHLEAVQASPATWSGSGLAR